MNTNFRTRDPLDAAQVEHMASLLRAGKTIDDVILQMRNFGWNKIDCIKTIRDNTGLKTGQAKGIVHLSPAWADTYESDEALHDVAEQALMLSDEEGDALLAEHQQTAA